MPIHRISVILIALEYLEYILGTYFRLKSDSEKDILILKIVNLVLREGTTARSSSEWVSIRYPAYVLVISEAYKMVSLILYVRVGPALTAHV